MTAKPWNVVYDRRMKLSIFRPHSLEAILMHHYSGNHHCGWSKCLVHSEGKRQWSRVSRQWSREPKTKSLTNVNYLCLGLQVNSFHKECLKSMISGVLWETWGEGRAKSLNIWIWSSLTLFSWKVKMRKHKPSYNTELATAG